MVRRLIEWAVNSPLIVLLLVLTLLGVGGYAFTHINVEAYPDPAPAIIEVVAQWPGRSAEEVERSVTEPLETALRGIPGLKYTRSKSLSGLSHLRNQFEYGVDFYKARQEVLNRLQDAKKSLPAGVEPDISPETPTGEIYRYTVSNPRDEYGRELKIFNLNDLKALEDWTLEREFKRIPSIGDVASSGGTIKRYEIHPDPDRLRKYGLTLQQVQAAIAANNNNVGGDRMVSGHASIDVRGIGLIGGGHDPVELVLGIEITEMAAALKARKDLSDAMKDRFRKAYENQTLEPALTADEERAFQRFRQGVRVRAAIKAAAMLRAEEARRVRELRSIVITSVNNHPVKLDDIVEGGPLRTSGKAAGVEGIVVGHQPRLGKVGLHRPRTNYLGQVMRDSNGKVDWIDEDEKIQGIVLLRKNEDSLPALRAIEEKVKELNDTPGRLLPGVQIEPYYDRTALINITTDTVHENLAMGMALVSIVLLVFLSNLRSALIVAINVPLALLFAFAVMYFRGKSANLLSIGAVDFGIIVSSSVIMVENIYRQISSGENADLPLKERVIRASRAVERGLFFSTAVMVCAFIPLFSMQGPEGQIFGPMADTYAFALGGALLLALTLSSVLCLLLFRKLKPEPDNFLVGWIRSSYLRQLERCLRHRWATLAIFGGLVAVTLYAAQFLGREFMPELEEGNLWIRGTFPVKISLERVSDNVQRARRIMGHYPEVEAIVNQTGRPDDGTDPTGFYNAEFFVPLKPQKDWPVPHIDISPGQGVRGRVVGVDAERLSVTLRTEAGDTKTFALGSATEILGVDGQKLPGGLKDRQFRSEASVALRFTTDHQGVSSVQLERTRPRTKEELVHDMSAELNRNFIGVDWNFSQNMRDNVMESLSGVKGDNSVKIFGPDLDKLESLADQAKDRLNKISGITDVGVFRIKGQSNLDLWSDPEKCAFWGAARDDVNNVIAWAVGGQAASQMVEGRKTFDITLRWPERLRSDEQAILNIPVDIGNNTVVGGPASLPSAALVGPAMGLNPLGFNVLMPALYSSAYGGTINNMNATPRRRLADFVTPLGADGRPDPEGHFLRPGASTIYREQGDRLIAVKFSVEGRDLGSAVAEAQKASADLFTAPYRAEWSGEFQEMEEANRRLMIIIPLSFALICVLLYLAFHSLLDLLTILSNVVALSLGAIWALLLTHTNFSISAAVGFISIFGVAIMDGLLSIAYFNQLRFEGLPLQEAIMHGAEKQVRPMTMTALTAILGLLPAAVSTQIGAQTQRPLAIVVVGGMLMTLLLNRYLMPVLYSFYGHREPSASSSRMGH